MTSLAYSGMIFQSLFAYYHKIINICCVRENGILVCCKHFDIKMQIYLKVKKIVGALFGTVVSMPASGYLAQAIIS